MVSNKVDHNDNVRPLKNLNICISVCLFPDSTVHSNCPQLNLVEADEHTDDHDGVDNDADQEGYCSGRLPDDIDSIHNCMHNACQSVQPEQHQREHQIRI